MLLEPFIGMPERWVVGKRTEQFVVTRATLVHAGKKCVDDFQSRRRSDALIREAATSLYEAILGRRMLEGANHRGADCHDSSTRPPRRGDRFGRRLGDLVRFVEREPAVELIISGRRDASSVGNGSESDAMFVQGRDGSPVERETC